MNNDNASMALLSQKYKTAFWHPNKENKGAGIVFEYDTDKRGLYATMMPQVGDKKFDNQKKIIAKFGDTDIAEFLVVLEGMRSGVGQQKEDGKFKGLYHSNASGSTSIYFEYADERFRLSISVKRGDSKVATTYNIQLSMVESIIFKRFLYKVLDDKFLVPSINPENFNNADDSENSF